MRGFMIAVVDYRKGNLRSVERGIAAAGGEARITDDAALIARADAVVLPGVGAFADAAATMRELGQMDAVRERIVAGVPFLGICLGMHLLFEEGVEGAPDEDDGVSTHNARGLAVLPGVVARMPQTDAAGRTYKVPHVGWNTVERPSANGGSDGPRQAGSAAQGGLSGRRGVVGAAADQVGQSPLFEGIPWGTYFYFTHGYIAPSGPFAVAETAHSVAFPSAVQYGDACFGVQFHPEKSSDAGAQLLRNFVRIVKGA